jgi:cytochrome P450
LWPTTPAILRQSTAATRWEGGSMPANTGVLIFTPFFHRDDQRLPYADRFTPDLWRDGVDARADADWPLVPFSGGPAMCPARNLVQLLTSAMLAALIEGRSLALVSGPNMDPARLPGTLNNFGLQFNIGR